MAFLSSRPTFGAGPHHPPATGTAFVTTILLGLAPLFLLLGACGGGSSPTEPSPSARSFSLTLAGAPTPNSLYPVADDSPEGRAVVVVAADSLPFLFDLEFDLVFPNELLSFQSASFRDWVPIVGGLQATPEVVGPNRLRLSFLPPSTGIFAGSADLVAFTFRLDGPTGTGTIRIENVESARLDGLDDPPATIEAQIRVF